MNCPDTNAAIKVSVVVTTYNRRHALERCLSSLAAQNFPANEYEIIVVADGCTDDTAELLRSFRPPCGFRWYSQVNQGQPAAQNYGVAAASGDLIIFVDDDMGCGPDLVAAHHEAHLHGERRVVLGATLVHPDTPPGPIRELKQRSADSELRKLSSGGIQRSDLMLCNNSSIARRAALECVFDISYQRIHDVEAGMRLWIAGYRPHFAPKAVAYELFLKGTESLLRDANLQGKYEVILATQCPEFRPMAAVVRIHQGGLLKRALRKQLAVHPVASEFVLRAVYSLANSLRVLPGFSRLARRVLEARAGVAHLKGAMEEAGSWDKLEELFGRQR